MTVSPAPALLREYRALLHLDALPASGVAVPVTNTGLAPHLRSGEFAIVDTADREPVHGELFLVASIAHARYWPRGAREQRPRISRSRRKACRLNVRRKHG